MSSSPSPSPSQQPVITSFPRNPLTETFTPPSDCNGVYLSIVYMIAPSTTCLPPSAGLKASQYFSPGLICPTGYASACHDTLGVNSITTVTCCPFWNDITLSCAPTDKSEVWSTLHCTWNPAKSSTVMVTLSKDSRTSSSLVPFTSPEGINAFGVRMVYQSTDLITSTSSTSSSTQTSNTGSTTSLPTSNTSPLPASNTSQVPSSSSTSTNSGLSTGAKAAIGIVVPLVALVMLAALFFWWKRRRQYKDAPVAPVILTEYYQGKTQLHEASGDTRRSELAGDYMPINHNEPSELPGNNAR